MSAASEFNLLHQPWIPVLYRNGQFARIGIREALTQAGSIRQIAASNPMDNVALLRFLLAVLMWCKENAKASLAALDESSTGIPESWLARLTEHAAAFNLLGDGSRFYQDISLKGHDSRPVADLLVEFPGADSLNHMRHVVHDGSYGFCPACCTMGILRLSVWAPANRFYPASVNPGSAAYALVEGSNLLQTFRDNLPEVNQHPVQAPWLTDAHPESPDVVARLAWRPRKLWLNTVEISGHCANCGTPGPVVTNLCIERGWPTPVTSGQQLGKEVLGEFQKLHDEYKSKKTDRRKLANKVANPKITSVILKCRMPVLLRADLHAAQASKAETPAERLARVFEQLYAAGAKSLIGELTKNPTKEESPLLDQQETQVKKYWVEDPHLLKEAEAIRLPDLGKDVAQHASRFWRDALRLRGVKALAVGIVGDGQYVFHDAPAIRVPAASAAVASRASLSEDCNSGLGRLLKQVTLNPDRQHPEIDSALKLLTPNVEAQMRDRLSGLSPTTGDDAADQETFLQDSFAAVVDLVVASATPGSLLRRKAARGHANNLLRRKIKTLVQQPSQPSDSAPGPIVPAKPKRRPSKGGQE